jgi:small-conductance mechanosensitive channel
MEADQIVERSAYAIAVEFLSVLPRIGLALLFLGLVWIVVVVANRCLYTALKRTRIRKALADLIVEIVDAGIWVLAIFLAAAIAFPSVTPASVLTGLGLGSVAIGFAFRDIFENFLAGVLILYREPFRVGDCIQCNGVEAFVEEITARDTRVRQTDGQRVVLPNAMLVKQQVWVLTDRPKRRTTIFCRVDLDADLALARKAISEAVAACQSVHADDGVQIFARSFVEGAVEFEVTWWTGSRPVDIRSSRDEVVEAVKLALERHDLKPGLPQREVRLRRRTSEST